MEVETHNKCLQSDAALRRTFDFAIHLYALLCGHNIYIWMSIIAANNAFMSLASWLGRLLRP